MAGLAKDLISKCLDCLEVKGRRRQLVAALKGQVFYCQRGRRGLGGTAKTLAKADLVGR